jgi:hypothetical protein
MALNFPTSPSDGQVLQGSGKAWRWNNSAGVWRLLVGGRITSFEYDGGDATTSVASLAVKEDPVANIPVIPMRDEIVLLRSTQSLEGKTLLAPQMTNPILTGSVKEETFTISDDASVVINPKDGTIQTWVLSASRTPKAVIDVGESVTLRIADGSAFSITWTSIGVVWVGGSAPTLATSGYSIISLWNDGGTIYGIHHGDVAS